MSGTVLLRAEQRETERRTPITPQGAAELRASGLTVLVESSAARVFGDDEYVAAGAQLVDAGFWVTADPDVVVAGIKELPDEPAELRHRHVYFAHAYKGQHGADALLGRFVRGGGELFDLEYLVDERGRRVVAFGYWAGFVGASLAALQAAEQLNTPLRPMQLGDLTNLLEQAGARLAESTALVTGSFGRAGRGAQDALRVAGLAVTGWDRAETAGFDPAVLVSHDVLVHCVHATVPQPAFLTGADRHRPDRRLRVLADVTADVTSALNLLPVSDRHTTWAEPVRRIWNDPVPLDAIVIDNLPSLLPREASKDFSAGLVPLLKGLFADDPVWQRARGRFTEAVGRLG